MDANFCRKKLDELTAIVQSQPSLILCISVFNLLLSPVTIVGNFLAIHALWKASSIPDTLKKLFLNLAFSDLGIGLFIQPMSAVILVVVLRMITNNNHDFERFCPSIISTDMYTTYFLVGASFFTIAAIAMDRVLALFLHLRYRELVTEKRVGITLALLWLTSGLATFAFLALPSHNETVAVTIKTAGLLVITTAYLRIYKVLLYHRNQIQCQSLVQNNFEMEVTRGKKSALNALYVYIIFFACYLPHLFARIFLVFDTWKMSTLVAYYASSVLIFLNSTLNPLIYCWRYREIRNIVKHTVTKLLIKNFTS